MLLHELIEENIKYKKDKVAVLTEREQITYLELREKSNMVANWLKSNGVNRGDRILIYLPNSISTILLMLAASKIGAIFVIIHNNLKEKSIKGIIEDSQPILLFSNEKLIDSCSDDLKGKFIILEDHWKEIRECSSGTVQDKVIPNDNVAIIYTSGSTGKAKGVVSTHNNIVFATRAIQERLQMVENDVVGCFLPLSFDYGLYQFFLASQVGATLALSENNSNGTTFLKKIVQWNVTCLPLIPSLANSLLILLSRNNDSKALSKVRMITNTGAHLPESNINRFLDLKPDCKIFVMFGLTECKRISILTPEEYKKKSDSVGRPLNETECFVVDEFGNRIEDGSKGELVVRGNNVMNGYWNSPELTDEKFKKYGEGFERVLYTGDIFRIDNEGYLYFYGRKDNLFKQNGFRISTNEIELAALKVPNIEEVILIPKNMDQGSILFVKGNVSVENTYKVLREELEDYKLPSEIVIVKSFSYTSSGKIDSFATKKEYEHMFK